MKIIACGYIKKEDEIYTALCVNMGLFGQGKTPKEAYKKVIKAINSYIAYILEKHPDECKKYLYRPAPVDFLEEYNRELKENKFKTLIRSIK